MENSTMPNPATKKPDDAKAPPIDPLNKTLKNAGETPADDGQTETSQKSGQKDDPKKVASPNDPIEAKHPAPAQPASAKH